MITFDRNICTNFESAVRKEWLETNGLGGYASSTIIGLNTRGYHGLLIAATNPPLGRKLLLSKVEEAIITDNGRYEISCNQYPNVIYPDGYKYLDNFRLDPYPIFTYIVEGVVIEKSVFMIYGENTTFVTYKLLESSKPASIELRPLIACRNFHGRIHENSNVNIDIQFRNGSIFVDMNNTRVYLSVNDGIFHASPCWYRNLEYRIEAERGQEYSEDLYNPGYFVHHLEPNNKFVLSASTREITGFDIENVRLNVLAHKKSIKYKPVFRAGTETIQQKLNTLFNSADQFIVKRSNYYSIIAGYHWFGDWGRDTMISLPGLTLVTGKYEIAKDILRAYANYCDQGMIPNRFPEEGEQAEYNSVDASLWFIYAVKKFLDYTNDLKFLESELYPVIAKIIRHYSSGTRYNIHADNDGLIYAGEEGVQLTWMDAKVGDLVVTPRYGKPVEINALWYNALRIMREFARKLGYDGSALRYSQMAEKTRHSFNQVFWNKAEGCLYDCINNNNVDSSIRPNQIFALSLPYPLLSEERAKSVLNVVQRELLTPYGLRSLSPRQKEYIGQYIGDQYARDIAYHQGTVWSWLLGPYITAYCNVYGRSKETESYVRDILSELFNNHLDDAGLGTISEIFDGDPPHHPRGCISQAWSVAEILRAYVEVQLL